MTTQLWILCCPPHDATAELLHIRMRAMHREFIGSLPEGEMRRMAAGSASPYGAIVLPEGDWMPNPFYWSRN